MGITVSTESNHFIEIRISGIMSFEELQSLQDTYKHMLNSNVKLNCLILEDDFQGWGKGGDWGDLTFLYESDPHIGKIAVVTTERWKDESLMFLGAGRRQAVVKHFYPDEEADARQWLAEPVE